LRFGSIISHDKSRTHRRFISPERVARLNNGDGVREISPSFPGRPGEMIQRVTTEDATEEQTLSTLDEIFDRCSPERVGFRLWSGKRWPDERPRAATIVLPDPSSLAQMFLPGTEVGLAEAYLRNDFDIEGDIEAAFDIADFLLNRRGHLKSKLKLAGALLAQAGSRGTSKLRAAASMILPGVSHSPERDRRVTRFHYNLSNDFFQLWLDQRMVYSCAYFESSDDSLERAQERKLDYLCRKLRLQPGQRILDIGCGWGGLVIHAAKHFGVHATGINLSERQIELARARIDEVGLQDRAKIELRDYREISSGETYDAIVSVGMSEHVGRERLSDYFKAAYTALKPGGVFLNHAIGEGVVPRPDNRDSSFIGDYVFPDSDIPAIPILLQAAESTRFEVRDVENLREHYALTLRHWLNRLDAHHAKALEFVDEPTFRIWRLYLAGCAYGFRRGQLAVYQTLLAKSDGQGRAHLPLTRDDWYRKNGLNGAVSRAK
jgi:cyclopropane-fatty-acyl-phospholipid synthase